MACKKQSSTHVREDEGIDNVSETYTDGVPGGVVPTIEFNEATAEVYQHLAILRARNTRLVNQLETNTTLIHRLRTRLMLEPNNVARQEEQLQREQRELDYGLTANGPDHAKCRWDNFIWFMLGVVFAWCCTCALLFCVRASAVPLAAVGTTGWEWYDQRINGSPHPGRWSDRL